MGEFGRAQREMGKEGCSDGSAFNWLHSDRLTIVILVHAIRQVFLLSKQLLIKYDKGARLMLRSRKSLKMK